MSSLAGLEGGQRYDLPKAIRNILGQMGQSIPAGVALVKELMQNADDAGADELHLYLDERQAPAELVRQLHEKQLGRLANALLGSALVVRNNRRFRKPEDEGGEAKDDFKALCEVAQGHKVDEVTSAGRFGIGFNSVYLVTENPLIYSRREIHVFDPRQAAFDKGGWIFPLADLRSAVSGLGVEKPLVYWSFPKVVMGQSAPASERATQEGLDCLEAVFRLPLRASEDAAPSLGGRDQAVPLNSEVFPDKASRLALAGTMMQEASRAIVFLKSLRLVSLWEVRSDAEKPVPLARVEVTRERPDPVASFLHSVDAAARTWQDSDQPCAGVETGLFRLGVDTSVESGSGLGPLSSSRRTFWVQHRACFDSEALHALARRLHKNRERCVPWVAAAFPADGESFLTHEEPWPAWRVFLPLMEEGPSNALLHAACFVDPSRRGVEYTVDGSDAAGRKTHWNQELIRHGLAPLLADLSLDLAEKLKALVQTEPALYLSLMPPMPAPTSRVDNLSAHLSRSYHELEALVCVFDLWGERLDLVVGSAAEAISLERVPDWLTAYRQEFKSLSAEGRRFVSSRLGGALRKVLPKGTVREGPSAETAAQVLCGEAPPKATDLGRLLEAMGSLDEETLDGCWALVGADDAGLVRYSADLLYLLTSDEHPLPAPLLAVLGAGMKMSGVEFVRPGTGLDAPKLRREVRVDNLRGADEAIFEALGRVERATEHDSCASLAAAAPLVDFLVRQSRAKVPDSVRLAWLVRTAHGVGDRRSAGVVMLPPAEKEGDATDLWEGFARETFAQVDPQVSRRLIRQLLDASLAFRDLLTSQDDVVVRSATAGEMLPLLFRAVQRDPRVLQRMEAALNRPASKGGGLRPEATRAALLILEEADKRWDTLSAREKLSVLNLPIHRTPEDRLIALSANAVNWEVEVPARYRLQGDANDLRDAPVKLPDNVLLLHSQDKSTYRFYRSRLRLESHGRVAVLKDSLRQIGRGVTEDDRLLEYLCRYLKQTFDDLSQSSDPLDKRDLTELNALLRDATIIPTTTGAWCRLQDAVDAEGCRKRIEKAGYEKRVVWDVLASLFHPLAVVHPAHMDHLKRLPVALREGSLIEAAQGALCRQAPGLSVRDRVRILLELRDEIEPSARASDHVRNAFDVPVASGARAPLGKSLLPKPGTLPTAIQRRLFAEIVDLNRLTKEWHLSKSDTQEGLIRLGVEPVTDKDLERALRNEFPTLWPHLDESDRLSILGYLAHSDARKATFSSVCSTLQVVLCEDGSWRSPEKVVPPCWRSYRPPVALWKAAAHHAKAREEISLLWDAWSPWRTPEKLASRVLSIFGDLDEKGRRTHLADFSGWLKRLHDEKGTEALAKEIRTTRWVPARVGKERRLARPDEVLAHAAGDLLGLYFLVADAPLRELPLSLDGIRFRRNVEPTPENIALLARCLSEATEEPGEPWRAAYLEVRRLLDQQPGLRTHWLTFASEARVFRLFRTPDRRVTLRQVFLQGTEGQGDFGEALFCLQVATGLPDWVGEVYEALGVSRRPAWPHLVAALGSLSGMSGSTRSVHAALVKALRNLSDLPSGSPPEAADVCLLACDGTYRPLHSLVTDPELGQPDALAVEFRAMVVDRRCRSSQELLQFLQARELAGVPGLRDCSRARLVTETRPGPGDPISQQRIEPWRDWLDLLRDEGSIVREALSGVPGVRFPPALGAVASARSLHVEYSLPDGRAIQTSPGGPGPLAVMDEGGTLYLRAEDPNWSESSSQSQSPDARIEREIARALAGPGTNVAELLSSLHEQVRLFLERPTFSLGILAKTNRESIRALYRDQTADESFEALWTRFHRTAGFRKKERADLEAQMQSIVEASFVGRRADQIRGHGYDDHSVFAELVQNAEDAYLQGAELGLPSPSPAWVRFEIQQAEEGTTLRVDHVGRPFNYWRHGDRTRPLFRHDVEGLLRSSGSFKPQSSQQSGAPSIGRFGLGFKSVYLLTDHPTVHSHVWHFRIDCGCIPVEVPRPDDLEPMATRIVLPLRRPGVPTAFTAPERARLLAVFLRAVGKIDFEVASGDRLSISTRTIHEKLIKPDLVAQQVVLGWAAPGRARELRFLRIRGESGGSPAQMALLLDASGMPIPWQEHFDADFFAALPLKARLGCGVAVSHYFAVESGRTHLRQDEENPLRFEEAARLAMVLVGNLVDACQDASEHGLAGSRHAASSILERFWGIWRWDRGDSELGLLRQKLAEHLLQAAEDLAVAPTLEEDAVVALGTPVELFSTARLPLDLVLKLADVGVEVPLPKGGTAPLLRSRTLTHPFLSALGRLIGRAGRRPRGQIVEVGWPELGKAFQSGTWLADYPHLVGMMARSLEDKDRQAVLQWLPRCRVKGAKGEHGVVLGRPGEFLAWNAPDLDLLPRGRARIIDNEYDEDALELLSEAGLRQVVPREEIEAWLKEGVEKASAIELLRYFLRSGRWRTEYYDSRGAVQTAWILGPDKKVSPSEARARKWVPEELFQERGFTEWLGAQFPAAASVFVQSTLDPRKALHDIYDWWAKDGPTYVRRHVERTYPGSRQPGLGTLAAPGALREWLILFLLGSLHTMGRTHPAQHRGFLDMCNDMGWLDIFARPDATSDEWMGVLDSYIDRKMEYGEFSHWMRQFLSIYQISRHLEFYVEQVLELARVDRRFELSEIFRAKSSRLFQGTGIATPTLTSVLGYGQNFVIRELVRTGLLKNERCHEHCYVPYKRVDDLIWYIRSFDTDGPRRNEGHFGYLQHVFGDDVKKATFNHAFDIPFQFIAEDKQLWHRFLGSVTSADAD